MANEHATPSRWLTALSVELESIRRALDPMVTRGALAEIYTLEHTTAERLVDAFRNERLRDRIAVFHFAGHAGPSSLQLESAAGEAVEAPATPLADFLGGQHGLVLVFLNGCSTAAQVQRLREGGVKAVIATYADIHDSRAERLAAHFYAELAHRPLQEAYAQARSAVQISWARQSSARSATGLAAQEQGSTDADDEWPWELFCEPSHASWRLGRDAQVIDFQAERARHGRLVSRKDVLDRLDALVDDPAVTHVLLRGGPGTGKSALVSAWLASRGEPERGPRTEICVPYHFIRRGLADWDRAATVRRNLMASLAAMFPACEAPELDAPHGLSTLLQRVRVEGWAPERGRLVLVIDGLDELYEGDPGAVVPAAVPEGVVVVCAGRPSASVLAWLRDRPGARALDLDEPWGVASGKQAVQALWAGWRALAPPEVTDAFIDAAIERAEGNVLQATLAPGVEVDWARLRRNLYASSSCGLCGKATLDQVMVRHEPLVDDARVEISRLYALPARLEAAQTVFARTGGLHAAGLFDARGEVLVVREDVGRHNAVDKVVGWALAQGRLPLRGHVLMVSGRVSYEITLKAVAAGIPVLAAVSAPSSLAVALARRAGLTLVAFLRGQRASVYAGAERIVGDG
ncbi:MAG: formate dehydrogenase accessory sulfurtransferase FdhD [Myxococcales bacterium]|nr:formate dehydrogenase accessory sulfurtransferase FdhD [Myxococcales bacterium]